MNETKDRNYASLPTAIILVAAAVVAGFLPGTRLWGINHLAYLPIATVIPIVAAALTMTLFSHPASAGLLNRLPDPTLPRPLRVLLPLSVAGLGLWLLGGGTSLLGDGSLVVREGLKGIPNYRAPLTWLIAQGLNRLPGVLWSNDLETTYRLISVLSGVVFLAVARWFPVRFGWSRSVRFFWLSFTVSSGVMVLFAGYVENYGPVYAAVYLYFALGLLSLAGHIRPALPLAVLTVIPFLHVIGVLCLPSAAVIALRGKSRPKYPTPVLVGLGAVGAAAAYLALTGRPGTDLILTLTGPYGIISPAHLTDLANELLLVSPALLLVVPILFRRTSFTHRPDLLFLTLLVVPFVFFTLIVNPGLGLARDWDLFSFGVFLPAAAAAYLAIGAIKRKETPFRQLGFACLAVAFAFTAPWLLINHRETASLECYSDLLKLYDKRSAYGYEILSDYWLNRGDIVRARQALQTAIDLSDNPRYYGPMGNLLMEMDRFSEAEGYYRQAIAVDSTDAWGYRNLGVCYGRMGRYREAEDLLLRAVAIEPRFALAFGDLGTLYSLTDRSPEARQVLERAVGLDPKIALNHLKLARVYLRLGRRDAAVRQLKATLTIDPDNRSARRELEKLGQAVE